MTRRTTKRQGQAALEFLTTYGWALLIIMVMIGAISYFGILNPTTLLPSRCTVPAAEFGCNDYKIESIGNGKVSIQLTQNFGKTIFLNQVTCRYGEEANTFVDSPPQNPTGWSPRNSMTFTCTMPAGSALGNLKGKKVKVYFDIVYQKSLSTPPLNHTTSGEIFSEVQ